MNNYPIPATICDQHPVLNLYGHYRVVIIDGVEKKELISICQKESAPFFGMHKDDFNRLIDEAIPEQN